jgi:hypothetical protein
MVTREEILVEVRKMPEQYLDELYQIVKDFESGASAGIVRSGRDGSAPRDQDFSLA